MIDVLIGLVGNTPAPTLPSGPPKVTCSLANVFTAVDAVSGLIVGNGFRGSGKKASCPSGDVKPLINPH